MLNRWQKFIKQHSGKGYTRAQLSKMYREKYASTLKKEKEIRKKGEKLSLRPKKFSKKVCRSLVSHKVSANLKEMEKGRYSSRAQAVAVSYSQVQKKYPKCKKFLKRST
jgi:hypothetical protein